jgi:hypothetical protein
MITTLSDCQAANDLYVDGETTSVVDVSATDKLAGCQISDSGEISFNSNFAGTYSSTDITGLCRTSGTINGCMEDFDCSSTTEYCQSGLCAAKTCSTNYECMKTGFCYSN